MEENSPDYSYYKLLQEKFDAAIKHEDGQLELGRIFKIVIDVLIDQMLIDSKQPIITTDDEKEKFCVKLNWFYSKILLIYINDNSLR
jgi:hypothetical protein